ncbi:MAG: glycosyltransferase family 4 protein [Thiocapsa sp. C3-sup]
MHILHVNHSDLLGGAARAAHRIHRSLIGAGVDSRMRVIHQTASDDRVQGGPPAGIGPIARRVRARLAGLPMRGFTTANPILHSPAWPDTGLGRELNAGNADLLNLHWLGTGTLSVEEVGRLNKPVVWTLHDMWAFCGAEHYADEPADTRFRVGYRADNCPLGERGKDLNRATWNRKRKHWARPMQIVCPSRWLASLARESALFRDWPVDVIPYPIDQAVWRPIPKPVARGALGLDPDARLVLVGAPGGLSDPRKGGDLALAALARLADGPNAPDALLVFGQSAPADQPALPLPTRFLGRLQDDLSLVLAYSAADVFVVPSRQDNLPNTVIESLACGTPVVGFDIGGLPDMIDHRRNGWLAPPFDIDSLANGIAWVLGDEARCGHLGTAARETAETRFSEAVVAKQYVALYAELLAGSRPISS